MGVKYILQRFSPDYYIKLIIKIDMQEAIYIIINYNNINKFAVYWYTMHRNTKSSV